MIHYENVLFVRNEFIIIDFYSTSHFRYQMSLVTRFDNVHLHHTHPIYIVHLHQHNLITQINRSAVCRFTPTVTHQSPIHQDNL